VPEDEIPVVPLDARVSILPEVPLLLRPPLHVEPVELPEPRELQGVEA
jgi:hypothetical protein